MEMTHVVPTTQTRHEYAMDQVSIIAITPSSLSVSLGIWAGDIEHNERFSLGRKYMDFNSGGVHLSHLGSRILSRVKENKIGCLKNWYFKWERFNKSGSSINLIGGKIKLKQEEVFQPCFPATTVHGGSWLHFHAPATPDVLIALSCIYTTQAGQIHPHDWLRSPPFLFSVTRRSRSDSVSEWVSQLLTLRTELTDVTLVSEDTYRRLYW